MNFGSGSGGSGGGSWLNIVMGGAALGGIMAFWQQIKAIVWKVCNLLVQRVEVNTLDLAQAVTSHLVANYTRSKLYDLVYGAAYENLVANSRTALVPYEYFGQRSMVMWRGWIPFVFSGPKEVKNDNSNNSNNPTIHCSLTFVRGTLPIDEIVQASTNTANEMRWNSESSSAKTVRRFFIAHFPKYQSLTVNKQEGQQMVPYWFRQDRFRLIGVDPQALGSRPKLTGSALDRLVFPPHIRALINEVRVWRESREWYEQRGIPWKQGWNVFGPGGTGKTALARAFGEDLDMPVFVFHLGELFNNELMEKWHEMQQHVPCIALIEDIDNVFHGRQNIVQSSFDTYFSSYPRKGGKDKPGGDDDDDKGMRGGGRLTFDTLLNCIDGVERSEGVFTIVTTNNIEHIDPALGVPRQAANGKFDPISTRPGRLDKVVELTYMTNDCKREMARHILTEYPDLLEQTLEYIEANPELQETPAQFQSYCATLAKMRHWALAHDGNGTQPVVVNKAGGDTESVAARFDSGEASLIDSPSGLILRDGNSDRRRALCAPMAVILNRDPGVYRESPTAAHMAHPSDGKPKAIVEGADDAPGSAPASAFYDGRPTNLRKPFSAELTEASQPTPMRPCGGAPSDLLASPSTGKVGKVGKMVKNAQQLD